MATLALGVVLLAIGATDVDAAAPRVLYPDDAIVVTGGGLLHVLAAADDAAAATMTVAANGGTAVSATAPRRGDGSGVLHAAVQLVPGLNTLVIALVAAGHAPLSVSRRVFFAVPLAPDSQPPSAFRRDPFHAARRDAGCGGCHVTTARPDDAAPVAAAESTCYSCHASLTRGREVHGPAAQWACTRCHDAVAAPARYATPEPVMPLCFGCHAEQKERFGGAAFQHGPAATGQCTICHNPHGTANAFFLKKPAWSLCTTCHAEKASGRHVIAWGPTGQGHPTRGRPDPVRDGGELSCASCHNPHAAPAPKLWNFGARVWLDLCRNCHRAIVGS